MPRIFLFLLMLLPATLLAQSKDEELAAQYYLNGEFEKAAVLYETLWKKDPSSYIYTNYLNTLIALKDFDQADKVARSQMKKFPGEYAYAVDRAWIQTKANEPEKAAKLSMDLVEDVKDAEEALKLGLALTRRGYYAEAEAAFLKGRKLTNASYLFAGDLAGIYALTGNKSRMIEEGILHAMADPGNMAGVQMLFQDYLVEESDWTSLLKELRQRVQKNPEEPAANELLMWALVQKKDFYGAFVQFRAMDKRQNTHGRRIMELASICLKNGDFDNAVRCYAYVVDLGESKPYYFQAQYGLLEVRYDRIAVYNRFSPQDVVDAEQEFKKFISLYGAYIETEFAARKLAHLYIFYLDRPDTAIIILQALADNPHLKKNFRGEVKLELGDAYLMIGEVWDAELIYSQVDKDFKEDMMGQEAKYRMARLFYFKGEFERSNAYLEVLKTATTQLISNNAIDLSLLILDNTGFDTTEDAMRLYAEAELLIYRNKIKEGMEKLDELDKSFPGHSLKDEILFARAKAFIRRNQTDSAVHFLERILIEHPGDILADNALFMLAQLNEYQLNNPQKAMEYYEKLLLTYPGSLFVVEARKRFRFLRGDKPDQEENNQILFDRFTN